MLRIKKQLSSSQVEKLRELWESTDKMLEQERLPGQDNWIDARRQRGIPLESNEFIRRVRLMNPSLWVEDSINCPGHANFYYAQDGHKTCAQTPFIKGLVFEFSRIYIDRANRPIGIEYGWRELLHRLLAKRLITWKQIAKNFPVYNSAKAEYFNRLIRDLKD